MPLFDWECKICGHRWEQLIPMDGRPERCPFDGKHELELFEDVISLYVRAHRIYNSTHNDESAILQIKKLPSVFAKHISWSKWQV
jgi:hypothetical protein